MFDQLIYNVDRNMGNLLIGEHVEGVGDRSHPRIPFPQDIEGASQRHAVRPAGPRGDAAAHADALKREIGDYVTDYEIAGLLARRDKIVEIIEKAGPAGVFDRRAY